MVGLHWQPTGEITAQVLWLGVRVNGPLAPLYSHQMNRVNSHNGSAIMTAL